MSPYVERVAASLKAAEEALSREVHEQQRRWRYRVHRRRIWFAAEMRRVHRQLRQSIPAFLLHASLVNALTTPLIYSLAVPFVLLDVWVTAYQWICFPIYRVSRVPRQPYFVIDRHKLGYLNAIEKSNCLYCSYANGVIAYVREIAARTEQYWCPIRHATAIRAPHDRYQLFFDYGDAAAYRRDLPALRRRLNAGGRPARYK